MDWCIYLYVRKHTVKPLSPTPLISPQPINGKCPHIKERNGGFSCPIFIIIVRPFYTYYKNMLYREGLCNLVLSHLFSWSSHSAITTLLRCELLKGAASRIMHLEKTGNFFQVCHPQSVLISLSHSHPCLVLVYYYFFGVFLPKKTIIWRFPLMRKQFCQIRKKWMDAPWHSSFNNDSNITVVVSQCHQQQSY